MPWKSFRKHLNSAGIIDLLLCFWLMGALSVNAHSVGVLHPPEKMGNIGTPSKTLNIKSSKPIWHHPAVADLFFDGLADRTNRTVMAGISSLTSSSVLALHAIDDLSNQLSGAERDACVKAAKALGDMIGVLSTIPSPQTDLLGASLATAEKFIRGGAALLGPAAAAAAAAAGPLFGGADERLLQLVSTVTARIKALHPGEFCLIPAGWTRKSGPDHALVRSCGIRPLRQRFLLRLLLLMRLLLLLPCCCVSVAVAAALAPRDAPHRAPTPTLAFRASSPFRVPSPPQPAHRARRRSQVEGIRECFPAEYPAQNIEPPISRRR